MVTKGGRWGGGVNEEAGARVFVTGVHVDWFVEL